MLYCKQTERGFERCDPTQATYRQALKHPGPIEAQPGFTTARRLAGLAARTGCRTITIFYEPVKAVFEVSFKHKLDGHIVVEEH